MPASSAGLEGVEPILVLDSWPVMEWLKRREPATTLFRAILDAASKGQQLLLMSTLNLGEIYYNSWTEWGPDRADQILADMRDLPILIMHPTEEDTLAAARIKALHKIAYGDAFAAILAIEFNAPVLSGDKDFLKLRDSGLIALNWIQK